MEGGAVGKGRGKDGWSEEVISFINLWFLWDSVSRGICISKLKVKFQGKPRKGRRACGFGEQGPVGIAVLSYGLTNE